MARTVDRAAGGRGVVSRLDEPLGVTGEYQDIRVWGLSRDARRALLTDHGGPVFSLHVVESGSPSGTLVFTLREESLGGELSISEASLSPDGKLILLLCENIVRGKYRLIVVEVDTNLRTVVADEISPTDSFLLRREGHLGIAAQMAITSD
ncbi:MAG: hypothetical protein HY815_06250 [Candidatus Riflebacteria bacterium]|nr:hypothetical protein [Candidatus Riflebacteria bacterium]